MKGLPSKLHFRIGLGLLGITVLATVLFTLVIREFNKQAVLRLDSRLAALENKTGIKTIATGFTLGFGSMRIDSLKIIFPKHAPIGKIRTDSDQKKDPDILALWQQIEPALRALILELRSPTGAPPTKSIMPRLALWLMPNRIVFDIAQAEIIAADVASQTRQHELLLQAKELHVRIDQRTPRLNFSARELELTGFITDSQVCGHLRLRPKTGDIELTISQTPDAKYHGWGIRVKTGTDTKKIEITLSGAHMPPSLASLFGSLIVPSTDTTFETNLEITRLGKEMMSFKANVNFRDLYLRHQSLAASEIGPLHLDANFTGAYDPGSSELIIDHGRIEIPAPLDFEPAERDMAQRSNYDFEVTGAIEPAVIINLRASGPVGLPQTAQRFLTHYFPPSSPRKPPTNWSVRAFVARTPCQALVDILPSKLAPALDRFELAGDFMGIATVTWPKDSPADFQFNISHDEFTCEVTSEPTGYAAESFKGPLKIIRASRGMPKRPIELSPTNPDYTPYQRISRSFLTTVVAAEDTGFWSHKGITSFTFLDALRDNLIEGRLSRGGSTITMQLVKNILLTPERTASRKVQEFFLAWHIGRALTRERILELYANVVEFGPNIFGVGEAADWYFGKKPSDLSLKESLFLVNLLPAPVSRMEAFCRHYQETENFTKLMNDLLIRMHSLKIITTQQFNQTDSERLIFRTDDAANAKVCHPPKEAT